MERLKTAWRWFRRDEQWMVVTLLMVLAFFGAFGLAQRQSTLPLPPVFEDAPTVAGKSVVTDNSVSTATSATSRLILVHVAGEVHKPGVLELPANARVLDAVRKAGGPTKDGDVNTLNLAAHVEDGQKIVVTKRGEAAASIATLPSSASSTSAISGSGKSALSDATSKRPQLSGPININAAGMEQLEMLPGIGPVTAAKIIEYRQQHGAFRSLTDLDKVSGIGPKTLENLAPHVTF